EPAGQARAEASGPLPGAADRPRLPAPADRQPPAGLSMGGRDAEEHASAQRALLETIEREVALFGTGEGERRLDPRVSEALARVPRERFVPADLAARAYDNRPLPIGHGQTISQPLIVAVMTHLLRLRPAARLLAVGTGPGHQDRERVVDAQGVG